MLAEASCHYDLSAGKGGDVAPGGVAALCGPMSDSAGSVHSDLAAAAAAAAAAKGSVAGTSPTSPDDLFRCVLLPSAALPGIRKQHCRADTGKVVAS